MLPLLPARRSSRARDPRGKRTVMYKRPGGHGSNRFKTQASGHLAAGAGCQAEMHVKPYLAWQR